MHRICLVCRLNKRLNKAMIDANAAQNGHGQDVQLNARIQYQGSKSLSMI